MNLNAAWAKVGRSKYLPHMGNRERVRLGLPLAFPRLEVLSAWVGEPRPTRQATRARARAEAKLERRAQVFAARHAKRIRRRKAGQA